MVATTSAAMAGFAASQAAIASSAASLARAERCKAMMPNFDAQNSTVAEMREYAECVNSLHPSELSPDATIALKILFVIALAGMIGGAWHEKKTDCLSDPFHWALAGMMWFIFAPAIAAFVGGVLFGIRWLFS